MGQYMYWTLQEATWYGYEPFYVERYDWNTKTYKKKEAGGSRRKAVIKRRQLQSADGAEEVTLISYSTPIVTVSNKWHLRGPEDEQELWVDTDLGLWPQYLSATTTKHLSQFTEAFPCLRPMRWTRKKTWR